MRTTIHDIAKASGLSPSTVSRVLTNNPHVSAEAKRKVRFHMAFLKTGAVLEVLTVIFLMGFLGWIIS